MRKEISVGNILQRFSQILFNILFSNGGRQMIKNTMFKLNKHTYAISGSTFVRPNWDIDNSRGRLGDEVIGLREDHLV
jgi:hypothetical protein